MDQDFVIEKYGLVREQLKRFNGRLKQVEAGEQIFAKKPTTDDLVEITPNVMARYKNMIAICEFTLQLIEEQYLVEADEQGTVHLAKGELP